MEECEMILAENLVSEEPDKFSWAVATILIGLGAEKYVQIFKKHNIGKNTLVELTDEDLMKLGVDSAKVRENIIKGTKSFPQYEDLLKEQLECSKKIIDCSQATSIISEAARQVGWLRLSMISTKVSLKKDKSSSDVLVFPDRYASSISVEILNRMESQIGLLESQMDKLGNKRKMNPKKRKILIGTVGAVFIAFLAYGFTESLKDL